MLSLELKSPWTEVKEKLKEVNINLTDEDLNFQPGQEKEMIAGLARKMNMLDQEVKDWIESVASNSGIAG
jgi:hypothetical protein